MATTCTTLSLCSSFTAQCTISNHKQNPNFISKTHFSSNPKIGPFTKSHKLTTRPSFLPILKSSESDAPVLEVEDANAPELQPEPAPFVEVAKEETKREEIFAVVMVGGRQYIVIPGRFIYVQRLKGANVNDKVALNKVLLVGTRTTTYIGKPVVTNAVVHAVVEEQGLNPKVVVFKYKKKKNYRRNIGHRQPNTRIRITGITGYQDYPAVTLDS
ncbi:50S ribosomal protein L21, chloroplastic [Ricinus communis]|uniref:50S ribosomal protein L21, putative n=1 Tax=Ricinus communis TaxID=3988 RepID=B9SLE8_RICCO|nr:50S ribosomal protein L21, chloroplastic [Ricinus communis]EEF35552.1 50S ribosomal protein L21, putative [Ricinus communis]|eukprot:XP_002526817.1 50S ribosomal protein L21, chloroplastic [Ricinus communis]